MADGIYALAEPGSAFSALDLNNEFNLFGKKTYIVGRTYTTFPIINDAPLEMAVVKESEGSWWGNLITGVVVTVALAALAVATVVTGGAALAVVCLAGAAIGAGVVTASVAITDHQSGYARSWGDFVGSLVIGGIIGAVAGASIYGLWAAAPIVGEAAGLQASLWLGSVSPLTYSTIPTIVTLGGYGLAGLQATRFLNEIASIGSGQNWMLDHVFGGDQGNYDTATMLMDMLTMGYMQVAADNQGLAQQHDDNDDLPAYADDKLDDIDKENWNKGPVDRGNDIDNAEKLQNNLGDTFPVADRLDNGILESTKSYDTTLKTYLDPKKFLSRIKTDLNKLDRFVSASRNGTTVLATDYNSKQLNVVIPSTPLSMAQQQALQEAKDYAESIGIILKIFITN